MVFSPSSDRSDCDHNAIGLLHTAWANRSNQEQNDEWPHRLGNSLEVDTLCALTIEVQLRRQTQKIFAVYLLSIRTSREMRFGVFGPTVCSIDCCARLIAPFRPLRSGFSIRCSLRNMMAAHRARLLFNRRKLVVVKLRWPSFVSDAELYWAQLCDLYLSSDEELAWKGLLLLIQYYWNRQTETGKLKNQLKNQLEKFTENPTGQKERESHSKSAA